MVEEKKNTSRKTSRKSSDDPAALSSSERKRVVRKEATKTATKESRKESRKTSSKPPIKSPIKSSPKGSRKESSKESSKVSSIAEAADSLVPGKTFSSMVQRRAREEEEPLLTTKSSSRSRTADPRKGGRKDRSPAKGYWQGQMLLASPAIGDQRFERSVIYLCHQGEDGALGLVVNKIAEKIRFTDVLDHLNISFASDFERISVHVGGPVESSRGFVLHSPEKMFAGTIELGELAMTASADILKQIAEGKGPKEYVFLLGYAGWGTGQLDKEIERNAWLHLPFDRDLVFGENDQDKWARAMQKLGVSPHLLSGISGNA